MLKQEELGTNQHAVGPFLLLGCSRIVYYMNHHDVIIIEKLKFVLDYIKSCGAADLIAWTIRLSFIGDRETSAKFHWLVLKSISQADRVVKRMAKNLPSQNLVKIWTRQDVHSLVGELMKKGQEHKDQVLLF